MHYLNVPKGRNSKTVYHINNSISNPSNSSCRYGGGDNDGDGDDNDKDGGDVVVLVVVEGEEEEGDECSVISVI